MSYSRWLNSKFYTYWATKKGVYNKGDEIFACHVDLKKYVEIRYSECKELIESIVKVKGRLNAIDDDLEAEELQLYMKRFIEDVDAEYLSRTRGGM